MEIEYQDFFEDISELVGPVLDAGFQDFQNALQNWMYQLEDAPTLIQSAMNNLLANADWKTVNTDCLIPQHGLGNGTLNWPQNPKKRMAAQTLVFQKLASGEIDITEFAHTYFSYSGGNLNDVTQEMSRKLFYQYSKDLNRYLERTLRSIPASDRLITIDHNAKEYEPFIEKTEQLVDDIEKSNSIEADDKSWIMSHLKAGLNLLKSGKIFYGAIITVLVPPLTWVASKLTDTAIGKISEIALQYLMQLVPL